MTISYPVEPAKEFLTAALGADGYQALSKAAERLPSLQAVYVPRAAIAWLQVAQRVGFEGQVPGTQASLQKGDLVVGDARYSLAQDFLRASSALVVDLLDQVKIPEDLDPRQVARLGKSVDALTRARFLARLKELEISASDEFSRSETSTEESSEESSEELEKAARWPQYSEVSDIKGWIMPNGKLVELHDDEDHEDFIRSVLGGKYRNSDLTGASAQGLDKGWVGFGHLNTRLAQMSYKHTAPGSKSLEGLRQAVAQHWPSGQFELSIHDHPKGYHHALYDSQDFVKTGKLNPVLVKKPGMAKAESPDDFLTAVGGDRDEDGDELEKASHWRSSEGLRIPKGGTAERQAWDAQYTQKLADRYAGGDVKKLKPVMVPVKESAYGHFVPDKAANMARNRVPLYSRMLAAGDSLPPVFAERLGNNVFKILDGNARLKAALESGKVKELPGYELEKGVEDPGQAAKPRGPLKPDAPDAPPAPRTGVAPVPMKPVSRARGFYKSELTSSCTRCGQSQMRGRQVVGCLCVCDRLGAGGVVQKNEGDRVVLVGPDDVILAMEDVLGLPPG